MRAYRALILFLCFAVAACSPRGTIDAMVGQQDQAFAQDVVARLRSGEVAPLEPLFDAEAWQNSLGQLPSARAVYPPGQATTELIGYHVSTNIANGASTKIRDYTLVTHDGRHWTTTLLRTMSRNEGPHLIVAWRAEGSDEMPAVYKTYQTWERLVPWLRAGGAAFLLGVAGLIVWLVRRSRRKQTAWAGQASGTP